MPQQRQLNPMRNFVLVKPLEILHLRRINRAGRVRYECKGARVYRLLD